MAKLKEQHAETVWDLPRNDVRACVEFHRRRKGQITPDEMSVMLRLQDDSSELMKIALSWK